MLKVLKIVVESQIIQIFLIKQNKIKTVKSSIHEDNEKANIKCIISKRGKSLSKKSSGKNNKSTHKFAFIYKNLPPQYMSWIKYSSKIVNDAHAVESKPTDQSLNHSEKNLLLYLS